MYNIPYIFRKKNRLQYIENYFLLFIFEFGFMFLLLLISMFVSCIHSFA